MVLGEPGALLSRAAVLGSPVAHSLSPALHQAAYAALGLEDWTYLDCLPYFRKAETRDIGPNDYHGGDGPVSVTTPKVGNNPLFHAMVEAGVQAGFPRTDDLNGYQQEGFGPMDRTVTPEGRRASTARGYLDQARGRPNLTIVTHATTDRILFDGAKHVPMATLPEMVSVTIRRGSTWKPAASIS